MPRLMKVMTERLHGDECECECGVIVAVDTLLSGTRAEWRDLR